MTGPTEREATGWRLELPGPGFRELAELQVAVWANEDIAPVSAETVARVQRVADAFARLGATVSDTARPDFDVRKANLVYQNLLTAVMSSGQPASHIEKIRERVATLDPADLSADAIAARASVMSHREWIRHDFRRERLRRAWDAFFRDWDVLVCPQFAVPGDSARSPADRRTHHAGGWRGAALLRVRLLVGSGCCVLSAEHMSTYGAVQRRTPHRRADRRSAVSGPHDHRVRTAARGRNRRLRGAAGRFRGNVGGTAN